MATNIFVNLPVKDLEKSKQFFTKLGYSFNQQFTDEKAGCLVISENIFAMLITEPFFKSFIPNKEISDTSKTKEVLVALSTESRQQVDDLANKAIATGGKQFRDPEIMDLCTQEVLKIWTDMCGKYCGWIQLMFKNRGPL